MTQPDMNQRLSQKIAAAGELSRKIAVNTAAGLITAALLGFWSPALKKVEPAQPQTVGKVNIDPFSGKILDRVDVVDDAPDTADVPQVRLKPLLVGAALPANAAAEAKVGTEADAEAPPQKTRKLVAKAAAPAKPRPSALEPSALEPESRNILAETPAVVAAPAQPAESEGWMSKLSPGAVSLNAVTTRLAPAAGYVSGGLAAAKRAVTDRLGAIGL